MNEKHVAIDQIEMDKSTQQRAKMEKAVVDHYAEAIRAGAVLPAVTLFGEEGGPYWIGDGWYRVEAHKQCGKADIQADVRAGGLRDAILFSVGANDTHGQPRTNADKRNAVLTMLNDLEWAKKSNREIADLCHVSHTYVNMLRTEVDGNVSTSTPPSLATITSASPAHARQHTQPNKGATAAAGSNSTQPTVVSCVEDEAADETPGIVAARGDSDSGHTEFAAVVTEFEIASQGLVASLRERRRDIHVRFAAVQDALVKLSTLDVDANGEHECQDMSTART